MFAPFNGLKSLVARLHAILTPSRKPKSRPSHNTRLGLELLETRDLLSATVPGFTLSGGNLYNPAGKQIDTGVQNFTVVNSKVYDLHTNGNLEAMNSDGSGKATLDTAVTKWMVDANGNAVTLDQRGNLEFNGIPVGGGIQSFLINGFGHVVELTTPATGSFLYEFMQPGGGGVQLGGGIQSFLINGFGHVVELTTPATGGFLYEFMQPGGGGVQLGGGIQSFLINGFGHVVELTTPATGRNLYEFMQPGGGGVQLGGGVESFFLNSVGHVVELTTSGVEYEFMQPGGDGVQIATGIPILV